MAYEIGTAAGHYDLLAKLRTFLEGALPVAERWAMQWEDTVSDYKGVIWQAPGLSGTEEIYTGIKTYQSVSSDYYNWKINGFTGYVPGNSFETQPGRIANDIGVPLWNQSIPYWFVGNGQRCIVVAKIENVYESFYLGKFLPYASPSQYPYPLCVGGMLTSAAGMRYSETTHTAWFKGARANMAMRFVDGNWRTPQFLPFAGANTLRNTNSDSNVAEGHYGLHSLVMSENATGYINNYGELDGVYFISGFNNAVENTLIIDGVTYVVLRDVWRTGFKDYLALRLQ